MSTIRMGAPAVEAPFEPYEFEGGPAHPDEVEIAVDRRRHTDLTMLDNELGLISYPLVPGREAVGRVVGASKSASGSVGCMAELHALPCMPGRPAPLRGRPTIVGYALRRAGRVSGVGGRCQRPPGRHRPTALCRSHRGRSLARPISANGLTSTRVASWW